MSSSPSIFRQYSREGLQLRIDKYFKQIKKKKKSPTLTGLALEIGCTRINIVDYAKTDEFGEILSIAKLRCEHHLEERITDGAPPAGLSFILKNNYGWKEKTEVANTHTGLVSLGSLFDQAALAKKKESDVIEGEIAEVEVLDDIEEIKLAEELF